MQSDLSLWGHFYAREQHQMYVSLAIVKADFKNRYNEKHSLWKGKWCYFVYKIMFGILRYTYQRNKEIVRV